MAIFALRAWRLGRKLPKLMPEVGKPDVVIGSSPHLLTPLAAYKVARSFRAPFVMEVRDLWPQTIIDMGELSPKHPITKTLQALEGFLYRKAARIITLLPLAHEYITTLGIPQSKIVWIPNGADLSRFKDFNSSEGTKKGFVVMYLGAHGQANALDVVIRAAKVIQGRGFEDIRFVLVGSGPEKPRLVTLARELDLQNVEFRDPVPKSRVPEVLEGADVTVFVLHAIPLYRYGISLNKLFDYWASGKPILMAGAPANNPVKEAGCGFTVPPGDPEALAEAVIGLYSMPPEEREAMGRRGRAYVEKHYSISVLADKLEGLLSEVVKEPLRN